MFQAPANFERVEPMPLPKSFQGRLSVPVIAAPMFIVSNPDLVIANCRAGVVGAFPALNARPSSCLEDWLIRLRRELTNQDAPFAMNLIVHKTNARLVEDLALCVKYQVPVVITSLGAKPEVNDAVHNYGGIVMHDVINAEFAHKAIEHGADGLIAVAAGAGGHAGTQSPFALVSEIREWFSGLVALSGAIASGAAIAAARALGADLAYIGSAFIATAEAAADSRYKQMILDSSAKDIAYSNFFTGVHGNYLIPSIIGAGLDPNALPVSDVTKMSFLDLNTDGKKAWRDIWGCGQGIGPIKAVVPAAELVARLREEYHAAVTKLTAEG